MLVVFRKAYVHGHYRKTKNGPIWVESYNDKRSKKGQAATFEHEAHRAEHVRANLSHGLHSAAMRAFHDLDHAGSHQLAVSLGLADQHSKGTDKKDLMRQIHGKIQELAQQLQTADPKALLKEAIDHLEADHAQKDIPPAEQAEDKALVDRLKTGLKAAEGPDPDDLYVDINGKDVPFRYQLLEASALAPTVDKAKNQYRDRTRAASNEQVAHMAGNLKFRLLADSPMMDYGSPVLAQDGQTIIGGNGRSLAIRHAYDTDKADGYRADLAKRAARFGLDPKAVEAMKQPVLVRVLAQDVDVRQAAIASNEGGGARMSALEQARVDGERLGTLDGFVADENGNVATAANRPFIQQFLATMPVSQRPAFQSSDGGLSQEGISRLRNAVLYRAYGDSDVLSRLVESTDPGSRNVLAALTRLAPTVAMAREDMQAGRLHPLDVAADIVAATATLAKVREDRTFGNVDEYLSQTDLFGETLSDSAKIILRHFDRNLRSAKAIGDFLSDYYAAVQSLGDPHQTDLFGDAPKPDKTQLMQATHDKAQAKRQAPKQDSLF